MGLPDELLLHTVVVVTPAFTTDAYNDEIPDYGVAATRVTLAPGAVNGGAWLQQDQRTETYPDGRQPADQRWLLMCNYALITRDDRIEWADHPGGAVTFTVEGPPEPAYDDQGYHHTEATLRVHEG